MRAAAVVLVALVAVLGLPAQAALANHPGQGAFNLTLGTEPFNSAPGAATTITATVTPANNTGAALPIDFEDTGDGNGDTPFAPDATCSVPNTATQCTVTIAAGATSSDVVAWVDLPAPAGDDADCEADRVVCGSTLNEGPAGGGGHGEPDNTDVVTINVATVEGVRLDCAPDTQGPLTGGTAPTGITCTQTTQAGVITSAFEIDAEVLAGSPGDPDGGTTPPPDFGNVAPATTLAVTPPTLTSTNGTWILCAFLDTNTTLNDTGVNGPHVGDGGDCAAEAANPAADDADGTDAVCVAYGTGVCPGGTVIPPTCPPTCDTPDNPVITGPSIGCNTVPSTSAASFRLIVGAELADLPLPAVLQGLIDGLIAFQSPESYPVSATDPDGTTTTLTASGGPDWVRLTLPIPSTTEVASVTGTPTAVGALRGTPSPSDLIMGNSTGTVLLTATDSNGGSATCSVAVTAGLSFGGFPIPGLSD